MFHQRLHKCNCMTLRRSSTPGQADNSNFNQLRSMEDVLKAHKMRVVHEIDLKGVSGSMPGNRTDIDEIIDLKKRRDDFEFLILPCADRFTRAGSLHGQKMLWDLAVAGITVFFVQENIFSDDERGRSYLAFLFDAAHQTAKQTSKGTTEGNTYSFLDGKSPHSRKPPFGLDRMYVVGKKPMHILRNLIDGTQQMWTTESDQKRRRLITTFDRNPSRGTQNHYRKQKNEKVALVPGDPEALAVVVKIMEWTWVRGLGCHTVARRLNDMDRKSPHVGAWNASTAHRLARNPIYIGLSIRCTTKSGIYFNATPSGRPVESGRTLQELANRKRLVAMRRPRTEWIERELSELKSLLPKDVREAAALGINDYLEKLSAGRVLKPDRNRHWNSPYLLTGIMRSKQGDQRMIGHSAKLPYLYYQTLVNAQKPKTDRTMGQIIPGRSLHEVVLTLVRETLTKAPLSVAMGAALKAITTQQSPDRPATERSLRAARVQQVAMLRRLTGNDEVDGVIARELEALDRRIASLLTSLRLYPDGRFDSPKAASVESRVREFVELGGGVSQMDRPTLKRFLRSIIKRMVVDLETRDVELDLALPSWMPDVFLSSLRVSVVSLIEFKTGHQTNANFGPILASFHLKYDWSNHTYTGKREDAA